VFAPLLAIACVSPGVTLDAVEDVAGPAPTAQDDVESPVADIEGFLFADPGRILDFSLTLGPDARSALGNDPYTDVHATFAWQGQSWDVGVHLKGSISLRTLDQKPSFKLDFRQWDPHGSFFGVHHLTLENLIQDKSMLGVHTAYWFYRQLGLPEPRMTYANVTVDGQLYGLYGVVETLDEQYLGHTFGSDAGNLYSGGYGADLKPNNTATFQVHEEGDGTPVYDDLAELAAAIDAADDTEFWSLLDERFDRDELLRLFAAELVVGNSDGYVTWANNFDLYDDVDAGRWHLLSVGPDQAFTLNDPIHNGWDGILAKRCLASAPCAKALDDQIGEVVDAWEELDVLGYMEATRQTIEPSCEADPRKELPCTCMDGVIRYVQERPGKVRAQMP
jgi:hypothetical protein